MMIKHETVAINELVSERTAKLSGHRVIREGIVKRDGSEENT